MSFDFDPSYIDKTLPVPVGRQLYGLMSYQLSHGDLPKGTKLPSVRRMAADLGIAQATVAQVYSDLRDAGLLEMRHGSGAYTCLSFPRLQDTAAAALRAEVEILLNKAERLGVRRAALVEMVNAQAQLRRGRTGLRIIFVGVFEAPAVDYVDEIRPHLAASDKVTIMTFDQLRNSEPARADCLEADLVLTMLHREVELQEIVPQAAVMGLRFIPSNETRQKLAGIDPRARVAAITQLKDYIAVMRPSVKRFAPHVSDVRVSWSHAPDLAQVIAESDVVIHATGADHIARMTAPGVPCFEYRHAPDPAVLEDELVPRLAGLRAARDRMPVPPKPASTTKKDAHQQEMEQ
ncbi:regulatory protein GntR, HTH [Oceanicola granulosus HTCC2516]|uniref:Regulatory protein GntR, HTH n=1 Tax=Oceanicola granulosus (strain ATCC BAA-861 / DSM 15982 / KCTC 12143 / HTCC2516) TaxID=314256 RepID=Q2CJF9_OCEGH|nr:GntR family transcriptional regulator [Oceanicola granulosus]EAR52641.1 regulatory protein GntR, HTH [Oceanicola granulosus HTCC2516]